MRIMLLSHWERKIFKSPTRWNIYYENYKWNNICPYIFNKNFIQSFCKGIKKEEGDIYIWIYKKSDIEYLCDLLFKVEKIIEWDSSNYRKNWKYKKILNTINFDNILKYINIKNEELLYRHFYLWIQQHNWSKNKNHDKIRKKFSTAIATKDSFQPRNEEGNLINIYDYFVKFHDKELDLIKSKQNIWIKFNLLDLKEFDKENFLNWIEEKWGKNSLLWCDINRYRVYNMKK